MAEVVHMIDSEVFLAFSTYATIVILKMMLMSLVTSYYRLTKQVHYILFSTYSLCKPRNIFLWSFEQVVKHLIYTDLMTPLLGFCKHWGHHLGEDHRRQEETGQVWSGCGKSAKVNL